MEILKDINQIYDLLENCFKLNEKKEQKNSIENEEFKQTNSTDNLINESVLNDGLTEEYTQINSNFLKDNNFVLQRLDEDKIRILSNYIKNIEIQTTDVKKFASLCFN